jgi:thiol:disulfide interchange protein
MKTAKFVALAAVLILVGCKAHTNNTTTTTNPKTTPPSASRVIYPDSSQAKADLAAALTTVAQTHKRILLDFGGNWCGDCQVLDLYFHDPANRSILEANFVLVHVNIGKMDTNLELADRYGVPLNKGVPALAVLDEHGKLLYSQKSGEFEAMRRMESSAVTGFLVQWKPDGPPCSAVLVNC